MARARKNIEVAAIKDRINETLQYSYPEDRRLREGLLYLLEKILHETKNYKGFRYLVAGECVGDPGINYQDGVPHPDYTARFGRTDDTRVQYY